MIGCGFFAEEPRMQTLNSKGKPMALGEDIANEAIKSFPPAAVAAYTLNDWLIIAGIIWIAIQAVVFIHKYIVWWKAGKPVKGKE